MTPPRRTSLTLESLGADTTAGVFVSMEGLAVTALMRLPQVVAMGRSGKTSGRRKRGRGGGRKGEDEKAAEKQSSVIEDYQPVSPLSLSPLLSWGTWFGWLLSGLASRMSARKPPAPPPLNPSHDPLSSCPCHSSPAQNAPVSRSCESSAPLTERSRVNRGRPGGNVSAVAACCCCCKSRPGGSAPAGLNNGADAAAL